MEAKNRRQFEIEEIVRVRHAAAGREYLVKRKGPAGADPYIWAAENQLADGSRKMLALFKEQNRRTKQLSSEEALVLLQNRRRRRRASAAVPAKTSKRRHVSASSVDVTPIYQDDPRQEQTSVTCPADGSRCERKRRRREGRKSHSLLEKQLNAKRIRVPKLHGISRDIAAASPEQRQQPRPDCPSGRVSTRKEVRLQPHGHSLQAASLAQLLSQPPRPLETIADALHRCSAATPIRGDSDNESAKPTALHLSQMVTALGPDGNRGHPALLAAALDRCAGVCSLDVALPEAVDSLHLGRRLAHQAAAAGKHSATLLLHLLAAGASPDVADAFGRTPLMLAARLGDARAVERLLQFDAKPDLRDRRGDCALTLAAAGGHWEAARLLLWLGAEFGKLLQGRPPGFDAAQLKPWTDRLSQPLLRALASLQDGRGPRFCLAGALPPHLCSLAPGTKRAFFFPSRPSPAGSVHLLVAGLVGLDGQGGVRLRRAAGAASGRLFASVALNDGYVQPVLSADAFAVYPLPPEFAAPVGQVNQVRLTFERDLPSRNRLKLLAQIVCATRPLPVTPG